MIDTLRVEWHGLEWGPHVASWLLGEYPDAKLVQSAYDAEARLPWEGMTWTDPVLGVMGSRSNRMGNYLWVERSLPKFLHGENCRVLSVGESQEAVRLLLAGVEGRFAEWLGPDDTMPGRRKVKRLDLCYQTKLPLPSAEVFVQVASALKPARTRRHGYVCKPIDLFLGGVSYRQNRQEMARWYDKGFESGDERYLNVVRHEEQLRGGKAGYLLDLGAAEPVLKVEEAIERMNSRYEGWGAVQGHDWLSMVRDEGMRGVAAALLVKHPEYEAAIKPHLSNGTYYRLRNMAMECRQHQVTVDLRLPANAWAEPMVL